MTCVNCVAVCLDVGTTVFGGDAVTYVMFTLPSDTIGSLQCTRNGRGTENDLGFELYFENGAIKWNYDDVNYLWSYAAESPERGWSRVLTNHGDMAYKSFADAHIYGYRDFMVNARYENMLKIADKPEVSPLATCRDAYNVERTIEAIRTSWKERCWVKLADFT